MNRKLTVGILCGGKSAEHEVSLQSARNVYEAMDREKFNPVLIGIEKTGRWIFNASGYVNDDHISNDHVNTNPANNSINRFILNADDPAAICLAPQSFSAVLPPRSGGFLSITGESGEALVSGKVQLDLIFPILHGPFGEDGTVQGLLKLAEIPFVGPGVLGSAAGMDKDVMKRLLRDGGAPIGQFLVLRDWEPVPSFADITAALGNPVFVKPSNMGSSVGVSKVHDEADFRAALREAFVYDTKVILEENIPGREIECSVLGNEEPQASLPGEVKAGRDFYSYEAKYIDSAGAALEIPAKLPDDKVKEIQALAVKTFRILECQGLSRVDFFMKEDGRVLVNEINTMPGFTRISMYPKLWEASGLTYTALITRLIELALARFEKEKKLKTSYS
ncbi:MAG: D-alanine--D-alanine ligase [Spirochaetaceae bacterium]|jgi:D-alanine-D-alanine ligase|nr:D-alanine--D-alanine ligase [Spirochaetaceae bacterium]